MIKKCVRKIPEALRSPEFFRFQQKLSYNFVQSFKNLYFLQLALCKQDFLIYNGTNTTGRLEQITMRYETGSPGAAANAHPRGGHG